MGHELLNRIGKYNAKCACLYTPLDGALSPIFLKPALVCYILAYDHTASRQGSKQKMFVTKLSIIIKNTSNTSNTAIGISSWRKCKQLINEPKCA